VALRNISIAQQQVNRLTGYGIRCGLSGQHNRQIMVPQEKNEKLVITAYRLRGFVEYELGNRYLGKFQG
jgi:hypothetical protein